MAAPFWRYLFISYSCLALMGTIATVLSALSNHATTLSSSSTGRRWGIGAGINFSNGSIDEAISAEAIAEERALFYDDGAPVEDRIVDPRDLTLIPYVKANTDADGTNSAEEGKALLHSSAAMPVVQLPLGQTLNFQKLYYNRRPTASTPQQQQQQGSKEEEREDSASSSSSSSPQLLRPRKRVYELVGLSEGGYGYEVKASFLGSPPANFDLKLFTLPTGEEERANSEKKECPCGTCACPSQISSGVGGTGSSSSASGGGTRRSLLDIDKVMFKSAAHGTAARHEAYQKQRRQAATSSPCCCSPCATRGGNRTAPPHPAPGAGVVYAPNTVTIDRTVALPYESEHVVRHFETAGAAARALGVSFLVSPTTASAHLGKGMGAEGAKEEKKRLDRTLADSSPSSTAPLDRAAASLLALLSYPLRVWRLIVPAAREEEGNNGPKAQPNRLFVVVSAYPKGVGRRDASSSSSLVGSAHNEEEEDFVRFNINLERMYLGQFPLGIVSGILIAVWPIGTVVWTTLVPRVAAVAKRKSQ